MKKKLALLMAAATLAVGLTGCNNASAKYFGGTTTLTLEPNRKLVTITWKEDQLWYLTREMQIDEEPETLLFQQKSNTGILEGTVKIVESK